MTGDAECCLSLRPERHFTLSIARNAPRRLGSKRKTQLRQGPGLQIELEEGCARDYQLAKRI